MNFCPARLKLGSAQPGCPSVLILHRDPGGHSGPGTSEICWAGRDNYSNGGENCCEGMRTIHPCVPQARGAEEQIATPAPATEALSSLGRIV